MTTTTQNIDKTIPQRYLRRPEEVSAFQVKMPRKITLGGNIAYVNAGDYVVTVSHGMTYICRQDVFEATHDIVVEDKQNKLQRALTQLSQAKQAVLSLDIGEPTGYALWCCGGLTLYGSKPLELEGIHSFITRFAPCDDMVVVIEDYRAMGSRAHTAFDFFMLIPRLIGALEVYLKEANIPLVMVPGLEATTGETNQLLAEVQDSRWSDQFQAHAASFGLYWILQNASKLSPKSE